MKRIRTDSETLQRFRLVLRFSQEQLQTRHPAQLEVRRQAHAHLQGQGRSTLELELLIIQLNSDWKTEFPTLLLGTRLQFIGTDAGDLPPENSEVTGGERVDADASRHTGFSIAWAALHADQTLKVQDHASFFHRPMAMSEN